MEEVNIKEGPMNSKDLIKDPSNPDPKHSKCEWHDEIQKCIYRIKEMLHNHETQKLNEEATTASREWEFKFEKGRKKGKSTWQKIQQFHCMPTIFRMKELQIYLENDIEANYPTILREERNALINNLHNSWHRK